ncbi:XrtB/PEP-CTERM-associated transcriptional regulator EpsA [Methylotenera sp.]|uniref:XrtB/PEP-CTERM-associated transcriptional regulator EpsA n=1 Tax=Methylotenera sp. TaxID=2051956 RepID=UPI00272640D6|nr:XrtB/PEP-CTERM-associated transcriptional regulator EpsA [Methylotenera sp.]MDO9205324.1 LuxR C-terminal-related transcriptional regulator [Methylotenera sp.]
MMNSPIKTHKTLSRTHWEQIFSVIQRSYSIDNHLDFFNWLQSDVNEILPHDVVLACWGDFEGKPENGKLNYDVASTVSGINTQTIFGEHQEFDSCMHYLHQLWLNNNRCWLVINHLDDRKNEVALKACIPIKLKQLNSLMVYGVSDLRGGNECLYVFFSKENTFDVPDSVMGLIMPHIDTVLRKIQHLEPADIAGESKFVVSEAGLSAREVEIIHWIKSGKTNQEIGAILDISQNTVKSHLKRVFQKMNVTRRAQAVAILLNK